MERCRPEYCAGLEVFGRGKQKPEVNHLTKYSSIVSGMIRLSIKMYQFFVVMV